MFKPDNDVMIAIKGCVIKNRLVFVCFVHFIQVALVNYMAFAVRFEFEFNSMFFSGYLKQLFLYLPLLLVIRFGYFFQAGLHKSHLRFSGVHDLIKIIKSIAFGSITFFVIIRYLIGDTSYPLSIYILDMLLLLIVSGGGRLSVRMIYGKYFLSKSSGKRMLIIGASGIGEKMVRDMEYHPEYGYNPIGFIDENPHNKGLTIHGVPIFGPIRMIPEVINKHKPDEILVSMTSSSNEVIREVFELSKPFNLPIKKLPNLNDILSDDISESAKIGQRLIAAGLVTHNQIHQALSLQKVEGGKLGSGLVKLGHITEDNLVSFLIKYNGISSMKSISLEDLLQREPVRADIEAVKSFIEGKSILVTGAGGSIGSELCRQIARYNPLSLILFDRYENSLYKIDNELRCIDDENSDKLGNNITTVVGDILDDLVLENLFTKHKPHIVFHAAAHKHVPLMEDNPIEAIRNNIFGSKNVIDVAARHNTENFVTISTDKAVNPTSIMGATKRVTEYLTVNMNSCSSTKFTVVRFGNVLGSNGSVVPLFKNMLKKGGPLTVTHPEMTRYFMLIPEAVQLVLMAAAAGDGGEIFVLEMGKQIKIVDLAENIIRLSGFIPHDEIKIKFIGMRPGEKLYEDLFDESEKILPASNKKLRIAVPTSPSIEDLDRLLSNLNRIIQNNDVDGILPEIQKVVHNFKCEHVNISESPSLVGKMWTEKEKRFSTLKK